MKQLIIRLDEETREKMSRLARSEGKSSAEVLRTLIAGYIKDRDISGYIDDLWSRSRQKLKARRLGPREMTGIIREVRAARRCE